MSDKGYQEIVVGGGASIKAWVNGVPFDETARRQLENTARLPIIYKWIAAMPDVHAGKGATVGSVIATQGAVIPAAVGVDIGCGMVAVKTKFFAKDLPDNLDKVRTGIERRIPLGAGVGNKNLTETAAERVDRLRSIATR